MLHICAIKFAEFLYRQCNLPISHQAVYIYGSELFFQHLYRLFLFSRFPS